MKIILDAIAFSLQSKGGVTMYFSQMLKAIKKISSVKLINDFKTENIYHSGSEKRIGKLRLIYLRYAHNNLKSKEKFIFHSSYFCVSKNKKAVNILTIHDCMYEIYYPFLKKQIHIWQKKRALKRSAGIVCVSESTKKDLYRFYPEVKSKNIKVIHHGLSSDFYPHENSPKERMLLYVSGRRFYKRFDLLVNSMIKLTDYKLVIVGGGPLDEFELDALEPIKNRYTCASNPSNAELNSLYNKAHCLVYTSAYEGFGLPLLESIGSGCPAICEDNSSLAEVVGKNYSLLVKTLSADIICEKVRALEEDSFRNKVISEGLAQSKLFCWDSKAKELLDFYKENFNKF
tara:strand:- start:1498 stop:2529 length:1032 start_codon:yes stop_codon:yes gene_type:complete